MLSEFIISCFTVLSHPGDANFEYLRSGARNLGGVAYNNGFQMITGMVLRIGTW